MNRPAAALAVLAGVSSLGFSAIRDPDTEQPIVWSDPHVTVVIQEDGSDDVSDGSDLAAIRAALATWSAPAGSTLRFIDGGTSPSRSLAMDGVNRITFIESNWPGGADGAGAFTLRYRNTATTPQTWSEFDIRVNGEAFRWATDGERGRIDIQSIVAHELGHAIGLSHASNPEATMYFLSAPGYTYGRTLAADDLAGLFFLYPAGPFSCSLDAQCPLYDRIFGGAEVRTHCSGGACSAGRASFGETCGQSAECAGGGPCVRDPVGPPTSDPGFCTGACTVGGSDCPAGTFCADTGGGDGPLCYLGRDDCITDAQCPGGANGVCRHDLDGRFRCRRLCEIDAHCARPLPGSVCHGGMGAGSPAGFCIIPGPKADGEPCESALDCASLLCASGGSPPTCTPADPGFIGDGGVRDTGPRADAAVTHADAAATHPDARAMSDGGITPDDADSVSADSGSSESAAAGSCSCSDTAPKDRGLFAIAVLFALAHRRRPDRRRECSARPGCSSRSSR